MSAWVVGEEVSAPATMKSIAPILANANLRDRTPSLLRIEKWKQLWVGQKNVYVTAFAMIDLRHHRCAATKRPFIDDEFLRISLSDVEIVSSRVLGRSRSERVGLARIRCKSLCRGDQLCLGYIVGVAAASVGSLSRLRGRGGEGWGACRGLC